MTEPDDHSRLALAFQKLDHQHLYNSLEACRGLEYSETACFAGLLMQQTPAHLLSMEDPSGRALKQALYRIASWSKSDQIDLGTAIFERLQTSTRACLELLHPTWLERLRRTERKAVFTTVTGPNPKPNDPKAWSWLQNSVAQRTGLFDPRHLREQRLGHHLEPCALRLAPSEDLEALVRQLGLSVTATVFKSAGKRTLTIMVRKLGVSVGQQMMDALLKGPSLPSGGVRVASRIMSVLAKQPHMNLLQQIDRTGLYMLASATAFRGSGQLTGLAHALPVQSGEPMLGYRNDILSNRRVRALHDQLLAWVMESLQHIASSGKTVGAYHTQSVLLYPPTEPLFATGVEAP